MVKIKEKMSKKQARLNENRIRINKKQVKMNENRIKINVKERIKRCLAPHNTGLSSNQMILVQMIYGMKFCFTYT